MVTNEERREVAHALRRLAENNQNGIVDFLLDKKLMLEYSEDYAARVFTPESVLRLAETIEPEPELTCEWMQDEDGNWRTNCGEIFVVCNCESLENNNIIYCHNCGGVIEVVEK